MMEKTPSSLWEDRPFFCSSVCRLKSPAIERILYVICDHSALTDDPVLPIPYGLESLTCTSLKLPVIVGHDEVGDVSILR